MNGTLGYPLLVRMSVWEEQKKKKKRERELVSEEEARAETS